MKKTICKEKFEEWWKDNQKYFENEGCVSKNSAETIWNKSWYICGNLVTEALTKNDKFHFKKG